MQRTELVCPGCRWEMRVSGNEKAVCDSCGCELPVYECPNCQNQGLVKIKEDGGAADAYFLCFSCGGRWAGSELERCPECYQWRPGEEFEELIICRSSVGFYVCGNCYGKIFK
ncbi:hypothetical protein [Pelotomaculum propionicicum]|uniref:Uncharacterized protein n=1 Tax=Pelotomaculum propionicicum TaxID=258475 RepID=A0A4Y7RVP0_9FIRM|nr:hypothetical protein [Pelotomaculum propionicicum]TEB12337.1 hypothetical protein Pmgp_00954 [Pelotomaculum propionicicum]